MKRAELQQLAEERVLDAIALIAAGRWSGGYYIAGYAIECGLKSCILARLTNEVELIFQEKLFGKVLDP